MKEILPVLIGAAVTFAGVLLQQRMTHRQQESARLFDAKLTLYADMLSDTHVKHRQLESFMWGLPDYSSQGQLPDRAATTGRVLLLTSTSMEQAWWAYIDADRAFQFFLIEEDYMDRRRAVPEDHEMVTQLRDAMAAVRGAVSNEMAKVRGQHARRGRDVSA